MFSSERFIPKIYILAEEVFFFSAEKTSSTTYNSKMKVIKIILFTIAALFTIYIITIFSLGYKIPQEDKHPEWPEFPKHSNPKIVVEEIKNFELKYGSKYRIPEPDSKMDKYDFFDYYKKM